MNAQINSVYAELGIAIPRDCIQQEWNGTFTFVNIRVHLFAKQ